MNPKKELTWSLIYTSKEMEENYQMTKANYHKKILFVVVACELCLFIVDWIVNPFNRPYFDGVSMAYFILLILIAIAFHYLGKRFPKQSENFLIIMILYAIVGFIESSQSNKKIWLSSIFFHSGCIIQLGLLAILLAKIDWKKIFFLSTLINCLVCFRFLSFEENYSIKYFPLILSIQNNIFVCLISYFFERKDRKVFLDLKKYEFSLNSFKEMIIQGIPNSIIITDGHSILFQNNESLKIFDCPNNEDLLQKLKKLCIEKPSIIREENFLKEKNQGEFSVNSEGENKSIYNLLQINRIELKSEKNMLRNFQVLYRDSNNETCNFEVQMNNIFWENKLAFMLLIKKSSLIKKVRFLHEQSVYKDRLLATVSHDLRTPLNGILGMLGITLEMNLEQEIRKK